MLSDFIPRAVLAVPAVIPHLGNDFYKTYEFFDATLRRMITSVYNGNMGGDFVDTLAALIRGQTTQAFLQAWEDDGQASFVLPEYLQTALDEAIVRNTNFDYIYKFYQDIVDARVDGTPITPLLTRSGNWANQYNTAYNQAKLLIDTENGGNLIWRKGATENGCNTCASLDGIVMSAKEWESLNLHPRGYPNPLLDCQGGGPVNNCDCTLEPTDKRRSPKAYDTVLNIIGK